MQIYYFLKRIFCLWFLFPKKVYTKDNLHELKGTELTYIQMIYVWKYT